MNKTDTFFNQYSVGFDSIYGNNNSLFKKMINFLFRKTMRRRFELTIAGCNPIKDKTVLDIGCGPGHFSIALAKKGAKHVSGVDFAQKMIDLAQQKAKESKLDKICSFSVGDFNSLDESMQYDYTVVMGFMDYMDNPIDIVNKTMRLTKNKAFFSFPCSEGFLAWQRKIRYKRKCALYLYSHKQLVEMLNQISCKSYKIIDLKRDYFVIIEK